MNAGNTGIPTKWLVLFHFVFSTGFLSCSHEYHSTEEAVTAYRKREAEPTHTIVVGHSECTECLDAYLYDGVVTVPVDLKEYFGDTLRVNDLTLVGNFPFDLIDPGDIFFSAGTRFKITGKLIGSANKQFPGAYPLFYVEKWDTIK